MPIKDIETRRLKQKLQKQNKRNTNAETSNKKLYTFYKIKCKNTNIVDLYVGQTCNFAQRIKQHKSSINTEITKLYEFIRKNGGFDNFYFEIICECNLSSLDEALDIENRLINELNSTLNTIITYQRTILNSRIPEFSPKIDDYSMEEYRYDILYSVIQLREIMMTKTRYNYWLNKHLLVLDELRERFNSLK